MPRLRVSDWEAEVMLFYKSLFSIFPKPSSFSEGEFFHAKVYTLDSSLVFSSNKPLRAALGLASVPGWGHIFFPTHPSPQHFLIKDTPYPHRHQETLA